MGKRYLSGSNLEGLSASEFAYMAAQELYPELLRGGVGVPAQALGEGEVYGGLVPLAGAAPLFEASAQDQAEIVGSSGEIGRKIA